MDKRKKDVNINEKENGISEDEYFEVKNASLRESGQLKKYKNEAHYYKKHLGNAFKSHNIKEHLIALFCFLIYAALFYFTIRAVFYAIPDDKNWKAPVLFGVFAAFFIGALVIDKLHRVIVVLIVKKDRNARREKGTVIISSMKSQHILGKSGRSQSILRTTYRVVVNVDGLRSVTYTRNKYYEKGEEIIVLINKKRYGHCYIPIE